MVIISPHCLEDCQHRPLRSDTQRLYSEDRTTPNPWTSGSRLKTHTRTNKLLFKLEKVPTKRFLKSKQYLLQKQMTLLYSLTRRYKNHRHAQVWLSLLSYLTWCDPVSIPAVRSGYPDTFHCMFVQYDLKKRERNVFT